MVRGICNVLSGPISSFLLQGAALPDARFGYGVKDYVSVWASWFLLSSGNADSAGLPHHREVLSFLLALPMWLAALLVSCIKTRRYERTVKCVRDPVHGCGTFQFASFAAKWAGSRSSPLRGI